MLLLFFQSMDQTANNFSSFLPSQILQPFNPTSHVSWLLKTLSKISFSLHCTLFLRSILTEIILKRTSDWILVPFFVFTGSKSPLDWTIFFKQLQDFSYHPPIFVIRGPFRCVWRLSLKYFGLMVSILGQGKDVGFSWHGQSSPLRVVRMVRVR